MVNTSMILPRTRSSARTRDEAVQFFSNPSDFDAGVDRRGSGRHPGCNLTPDSCSGWKLGLKRASRAP